MERRVTGTELRGLQKLAERIKKGEYGVLVGVPEDKFEDDGTSVAEIAMWNEFGTSKIPERSFLRAGINNNLERFKALNAQSLKAIAEGTMTIEVGLGRLGAMAAGAVKQQIRNGEYPPNAPSTIAAKGSSKPLIDTGNLMQSITWKIDDGRGGGTFVGESL